VSCRYIFIPEYLRQSKSNPWFSENIKFPASVLIAFAILSLPAYPGTIYDDVEITGSDEYGVSFVLNVSEPHPYMEIDPRDSTFILIKTVLIGIPPGRRPFISTANGSSPGFLNGVDLKPIKSADLALAEIAEVKTIRGKDIAVVNIYPYYRNKLFSRVEVTVDFTEFGTRTEYELTGFQDKYFDAIFRSSILNFDRFDGWPAKRRLSAYAKRATGVLDSAQVWYKITTVSEGLTKITGGDLSSAGVSLDSLSSDSFHLFYGGGKPVPVLNSDTMPRMKEAAIEVRDGGDGIFNASDHFIFFAQGADSWRYPSDSSPYFLENHYTGLNCYWLAVSGDFAGTGKRIASFDGSPTGGLKPSITQTWFFSRENRNNILHVADDGHVYDFYNWYWTTQYQYTFFMNLPRALSGESTLVRIRAEARDVALSINGWEAAEVSGLRPLYIFTSNNINTGLNSFRVIMDSSANASFDFCEVSYPGDLTPSADVLDFYLAGESGRNEIILENNFSELPVIYRLIDPWEPQLIEGASFSDAEIIFEYDFLPSEPGRMRFYACPPSKTHAPLQIRRVIPRDITRSVSQTDMIVIAPEQLWPYLDEYVQYREESSNINVLPVTLEEIIDQFSYGLYDPGAIREYLKFAYENYPSPPPASVLLVGDGVYDYEDNSKTGSVSFIPPYIHPQGMTASDDNYVYFGNFGLLDSDTSYCDTCEDRGYDMMIARWPVRNVSELNTIIQKVESYESSTNYGPWRTTVTLVADDEYGSQGRYEGLDHTVQTETLEKYCLPAAFRRNKIYLWEYPYDSYRNKPGVNDAVVGSVNYGTLVINYVGHGNPDTWAHEHVFNRGTDLQKLNNADRLTLVFTASCSIGFYDSPSGEGMAEEMLRAAGGGAIAVVAATRIVYSEENAGFNREVFKIIFGPEDLSICQALFAGKLLRQYSFGNPVPRVNDRKYAFFGDPFLHLGVPEYRIDFTGYPDTLTALDIHHVSGEVLDGSTGTHVDFDGSSEIFVYDSEIKKTYKGINDNGQVVDSLIYAKAGPVIYKGLVDIIDGYFEFSFIAPLDIGYGGAGAKISAYAMTSQSDAFGLADSIAVSLDIVATSDSVGPQIEYTFADRRNFVSGDIITAGEILLLNLSDSSGINLSGTAGHGIALTVDNDIENIVNLTDLFQYNAGSFTAGEIRYDIGQLSAGRHRLKIKAWDNANNSAVVEFDAVIAEWGHFALLDLLNYPNPMNERTTFSFSLTSPARKVHLEIFTLSGKRIFSYEENALPGDFHEFFSWDGRDADGDRIATGVYIYKVTASSMLSDEVAESFGKVVVNN
jgi:hypothetical protein